MEKMKDLAYYNGKITSIDDMNDPANDRGFYFGDGIYEAAMVFDYKIYALQDHLDRMFNSAAMLRIELPYTKEGSRRASDPTWYRSWRAAASSCTGR